MVPDNN